MKNTFVKFLTRFGALMLLVAVLLTAICACDSSEGSEDKTEAGENTHVDYAASVKLDMSAPTLKQEVTVNARYLAINTPESTGKIEEWGKTAAKYTKEKLQNATSIIIESEDNEWNADSTGGRYLVWVWYKTADSEEYRNLNIEILQNGLAIASNSANNRYGDTCMNAINQAKAEKLHVHSGEKDPNFPYGEAAELTLKELRMNVTEYDNMKVAFEGVVTKNNSNTVFVEE